MPSDKGSEVSTFIKSANGRIDILFANAGLVISSRSDQLPRNPYRTFGVNVKGTLFTVPKALPLMRSGGSVGRQPRQQRHEGSAA
ncbi:SDR family NAD(P)-dependent oxidoreductase [Pseudomonas syringae]|uniref:SDR family NAD(P)-dependent oxidoreductase n=1 Tax=Pseudomonas syringae TaxID=317 RepID=UPI001604C94E